MVHNSQDPLLFTGFDIYLQLLTISAGAKISSLPSVFRKSTWINVVFLKKYSCLLPTERRRKGPRPAEPHRLKPVHPRPQKPDSRAETRGEICETGPLAVALVILFCNCFLVRIQILLLTFLWSGFSEDFTTCSLIWFYFEANRLVQVLTTPRDFLCGVDIAHLLQIPSLNITYRCFYTNVDVQFSCLADTYIHAGPMSLRLQLMICFTIND